MYFIYGTENYLVEQKTKNIIAQNQGFKVVNFGSETKLNQAMNEILSHSLFDDDKLVIFNDFSLLTKKQPEEQYKQFINCLKYKQPSIKIIFTLNGDVTKFKSPLLTFLQSNSENVDCKQMNDRDLSIFVKKYINEKQGTISEIDLYYLLSKLPKKLMLIINEVDKLIQFSKNINRDNIDNLIPDFDLSSSFDFINAFNDMDVDRIWKVYYDKIQQGESVTNLIGQLASVLEVSSQIYSYRKIGKSMDDIAKELKKNIYYIKKCSELLSKLSYKSVLKYINKLSEIDFQIKSGVVEEKIAFESFLLDFIKNKNT